MAGEFIKGESGKDCTEKTGGWGNASTSFDWIWKGNIDEDKYPEEACLPWYHRNFQVDDIQTLAERLRNAGVHVFGEPVMVPSGIVKHNAGQKTLLYFADPDGVILELAEYK